MDTTFPPHSLFLIVTLRFVFSRCACIGLNNKAISAPEGLAGSRSPLYNTPVSVQTIHSPQPDYHSPASSSWSLTLRPACPRTTSAVSAAPEEAPVFARPTPGLVAYWRSVLQSEIYHLLRVFNIGFSINHIRNFQRNGVKKNQIKIGFLLKYM